MTIEQFCRFGQAVIDLMYYGIIYGTIFYIYLKVKERANGRRTKNN